MRLKKVGWEGLETGDLAQLVQCLLQKRENLSVAL